MAAVSSGHTHRLYQRERPRLDNAVCLKPSSLNWPCSLLSCICRSSTPTLELAIARCVESTHTERWHSSARLAFTKESDLSGSTCLASTLCCVDLRPSSAAVIESMSATMRNRISHSNLEHRVSTRHTFAVADTTSWRRSHARAVRDRSPSLESLCSGHECSFINICVESTQMFAYRACPHSQSSLCRLDTPGAGA